MKKFKIDHEVLGLSPMGEAPKKEQRLVLARTFNDELSSVARKYPGSVLCPGDPPQLGD